MRADPRVLRGSALKSVCAKGHFIAKSGRKELRLGRGRFLALLSLLISIVRLPEK
jgi:hypothetical protein